MSKKNFIFLSLLLGTALFVNACSSETSNTSTEKAEKNEATSELLMVSADTVSEKGGCVLASRYTAGDKIIFRVNALDPNTNEQVKDAKVQIQLSTGEVLDAVYGEHGDDNFWVAAYEVTADTPTGTLEYQVMAEDGERKGEFKPFNVQPSLLSIVAAETVEGQAQEEKAEEKKSTKETADITPNQTVDIVATNFKFNQEKFYVKAGEEVTVNLTSEEGGHGIAINGLDVSIDEPNGTVKFTPTEPGEYQIVCSIFCGEGHGDMIASLVVV